MMGICAAISWGTADKIATANCRYLALNTEMRPHPLLFFVRVGKLFHLMKSGLLQILILLKVYEPICMQFKIISSGRKLVICSFKLAPNYIAINCTYKIL